MKLINNNAEIYVPDGSATEQALHRTSHLAIGAHQDDLEIMAIDGILQCFQQSGKWFTGVVVTDGSGSPRSGVYANYSNEQMMSVRMQEQKKAAEIGEYSAQVLLKYPSSAVKDPQNKETIKDLTSILQATRPQVVYTHNLADKHPTHVGVAVKVILALRNLPPDMHPEKLYGCEVWRGLDWMMDEDKVALECSDKKNLQASLVGVFDSQISGGKRYDLATMGRRTANATYFASHGVDDAEGLVYAMDLTPLIKHPGMDIPSYVRNFIDRFSQDVDNTINNLL